MKLLLGGSPCTYWSVAQSPDKRETTAEGLGWELFKNYLIARDKFQPDYFLYENNKSMSKEIKAQITAEFGFEPVLINSALVSAQNRQRLYWAGKRQADGTYQKVDVVQPNDRWILLRDVIDGDTWIDKSYAVTTRVAGAIVEDTLKRHRHTMVAEPVGLIDGKKSYAVKAQYGKNGTTNFVKDGFQATGVAMPVRVGCMPSPSGEIKNSQAMRIYSTDGKAVNQVANGGGLGAKTGLYAVPVQFIVPEATKKGFAEISPGECVDMTQPNSKTRRGRKMAEKSNCIMTGCQYYQYCGTLDQPIYQVKDGQITIKEKTYPIKLVDGFYIIRKLTVQECMRLQTVPEWYEFPVSNSQAYKCLGNGWTVEVIKHILNHFVGVDKMPLDVLSMYDGMSCGHIALDGIGAKVERYRATEIDKYAIATTMHNYPDTIQLGDAFAVRGDVDIMADCWG